MNRFFDFVSLLANLFSGFLWWNKNDNNQYNKSHDTVVDVAINTDKIPAREEIKTLCFIGFVLDKNGIMTPRIIHEECLDGNDAAGTKLSIPDKVKDFADKVQTAVDNKLLTDQRGRDKKIRFKQQKVLMLSLDSKRKCLTYDELFTDHVRNMRDTDGEQKIFPNAIQDQANELLAKDERLDVIDFIDNKLAGKWQDKIDGKLRGLFEKVDINELGVNLHGARKDQLATKSLHKVLSISDIHAIQDDEIAQMSQRTRDALEAGGIKEIDNKGNIRILGG